MGYRGGWYRLRLDDAVGGFLDLGEGECMRVFGVVGALEVRVVVDTLAGMVARFDDSRVWRDDEGLGFLWGVEHLAVAPEAECARPLLASVTLVEVDNEAYEPRRTDTRPRDRAGNDGCLCFVSEAWNVRKRACIAVCATYPCREASADSEGVMASISKPEGNDIVNSRARRVARREREECRRWRGREGK